MYSKYIEELKNGKQVRIKHNQRYYDYCEEEGWWSEELWRYDNTLNLFKCFYPVSSYEKDFYTTHTQDEVEGFFSESIRDADIVTDIIIENYCTPNS